MQFEFATGGRIVFGAGTAARIDSIAAEFGSRPLLVTGVRGATGTSFVVRGEPSVEVVREGASICRSMRADVVIAIGGGSVMDAAKAIAILANNSGEPLDYIEVVGRGQPFERGSLPVIAVPTTAGTGSEVTRNAVLGSKEHGVKASLRSPHMLPRVAIIDPELSLDLPPAITASTGMDALTQLIEPYVSARANPMTDMFCTEGIPRIARSLRRACADGHDRDARSDMAFAALLGGLALANAGLGVVHGFAAPIGGMYGAPHGAVCAALLPHGMAANLRSRPERFTTIARLLTGQADAAADDGIEWVRRLSTDLSIPGLRTYGVTDSSDLVERAANASSMKANPVVLSAAALHNILRAAL